MWEGQVWDVLTNFSGSVWVGTVWDEPASVSGTVWDGPAWVSGTVLGGRVWDGPAWVSGIVWDGPLWEVLLHVWWKTVRTESNCTRVNLSVGWAVYLIYILIVLWAIALFHREVFEPNPECCLKGLEFSPNWPRQTWHAFFSPVGQITRPL